MNPLLEVADIRKRLMKPTPPEVRAQLELRIKELEAEYVSMQMHHRDDSQIAG